MNGVDVVLVFLLAVYALRGYWRGFLREAFGLFALAGGIWAAFRFAAAAVVVVPQHLRLPAPVQAGVAFVVVFAVIHTAMNLVGVLLDRLRRTTLVGGVNRMAGVALGAGKGAAILAFVLLFLHLFSLSSNLDGHIMSSRMGPPLVNAAAKVVRLGLPTTPQSDSPNKT